MAQGSSSKYCVIVNCKNKSTADCSVCGMPICSYHQKKFADKIVCINCFPYMRR